MGKLYIEYIDHDKIYRCGACKTHLTETDNIVSKVQFIFQSKYDFHISKNLVNSN